MKLAPAFSHALLPGRFRLARQTLLILLLLALPECVCVTPAAAQWSPAHGERIRTYQDSLWNWASSTWNDIGNSSATGTCRICNRETMFGRDRCFDCMRSGWQDQARDWANQAMESGQDAVNRLSDPKTRRELADRLSEVRRQLQQQREHDTEQERAMRRQTIDSLGEIKVGPEGRPLRDLARDTVNTWVPALEGTDMGQDPIRVMSYYLALDGKGFIKNVRCVRGPMGEPMTLLEAYEAFSKTNPQQAEHLLEIIDDVRRLNSPSCDEERLPLILDALERSLRLLDKPGD